MAKFIWQNGTKVEPAKVEIDNQTYEVQDAQYEGETPLSAGNLNAMQDGIYEDINKNKQDITSANGDLDVLKYNIVTDGSPVKTGIKLDGNDVYVTRVKMNNLPKTGQQKDKTLPFTLANVNVLYMVGIIYNKSTESVYPLDMGDVNNNSGYAMLYRLNGGNNSLRVWSGTDNFASTEFDAIVTIFFTYRT